MTKTDLIVWLRCFFGFHRMPKWGEREKAVVVTNGYKRNAIVQRRHCPDCNVSKMRVVSE